MDRYKTNEENGNTSRPISGSDGVVVVAVALVLAAILLPAIASTNSDRAESILNAAPTPAVFDGAVKPMPASPDEQHATRAERRLDDMQASASDFVGDSEAMRNHRGWERRRAAAMERFLTTDIRYQRP